MAGKGLLNERSTLTTAILSEQNSTHFAAKRRPHKWNATTTGKNPPHATDKGPRREDPHPQTTHYQRRRHIPVHLRRLKKRETMPKEPTEGRAGN